MSDPLPNDDLDRVLRGLWQRAPQPLLRLLFNDPDLVVEALENPAPVLLRRAADAAARVRDARGTFLAHVEFETHGRQEVVARAALYGLMLYHSVHLPVRSLVVLLEPTTRLSDAFQMRHGEELRCHYKVDLVRLYEIPATTLADRVDFAALAPLGAQATTTDLRRAANTIRQQAPRPERADLLAALYIIGGRRFALADVLQTFSREELMESVTYRHLVEESMREGQQRGWQKGRQEGRQEGRDALASLLLGLLRSRFPGELDRLRPLLSAASLEDLSALGEDLLQAGSAEDLRRRVSDRLGEG